MKLPRESVGTQCLSWVSPSCSGKPQHNLSHTIKVAQNLTNNDSNARTTSCGMFLPGTPVLYILSLFRRARKIKTADQRVIWIVASLWHKSQTMFCRLQSDAGLLLEVLGMHHKSHLVVVPHCRLLPSSSSPFSSSPPPPPIDSHATSGNLVFELKMAQRKIQFPKDKSTTPRTISTTFLDLDRHIEFFSGQGLGAWTRGEARGRHGCTRALGQYCYKQSTRPSMSLSSRIRQTASNPRPALLTL